MPAAPTHSHLDACTLEKQWKQENASIEEASFFTDLLTTQEHLNKKHPYIKVRTLNTTYASLAGNVITNRSAP